MSTTLDLKTWSRRLGLAMAVLALAIPGLALAAESKAPSGPTPEASDYAPLGRLVVMFKGRPMPFDTVARQEVKLINGRQSFSPIGPSGTEGAEWGPVAAMFSWQNASDYWDDQRFILAEYLPFRRLILSGQIRALLEAVAADPKTTPEIKERVEGLLARQKEAEGPEGIADADTLKELARAPGLPDGLQDRLESMAHRIDGGEKVLSPRELEEAEIPLLGRSISLKAWYGDILMHSRPDMKTGMTPSQTTLEKRVTEVFVRLARYQAIRGDRGGMFLPNVSIDRLVPRPATEAYLQAMADIRKKYDAFVASNKEEMNLPLIDRVTRDMRDVTQIFVETEDGREFPLDQFVEVLDDVPGADFNDVELDTLATLVEHYSDLPVEDRKIPGTDDDFDAELLAWLGSDANWASSELLLKADVGALAAAGYDRDAVDAFRTAITHARLAEADHPGGLEAEQASAAVASARTLSSAVNRYPTPAEVDREVHYNTFAPFYKAPLAYGAGFVMLGLCLMIGTVHGGTAGTLRQACYGLGLFGLVAGIGLEIYGFALRVMISGWAPVTGLYETVIWVALVSAGLGLILELVYGRVYPATAAAGVAMFCTIIAANAQSVLNPDIEALNPVLRSNYWLTIHVLTIVSSYAAFALALGLGLIGTWYYLTAPYRRDVSVNALGRPLLAVPAFAGLGALLLYGHAQHWASPNTELVQLWGMGLSAEDALFFGGWALVAAGIAVAVMVVTGMLGEFVARITIRNQAETAEDAFAAPSDRDALAPELAMAGAGGGGTATIARPSVAEIKARIAEGNGGPIDESPRDRAMRTRAELLKPIGGFVYRALQVGVLLVAAGTILGGVWADYSWGRFWGWDPKEVSALITLLVYLVPLHGRFAGWINPFGMICASVLCFNSVLMAWYGVNFLLGVGLHSYGFAEGGNQGAVLLSALVVSSISFGAIWRRSLARRMAPNLA